jgi:hypothetical protein
VPQGEGSAARRQHFCHLLKILCKGWLGGDGGLLLVRTPGQAKALSLDPRFLLSVSENDVISAISLYESPGKRMNHYLRLWK